MIKRVCLSLVLLAVSACAFGYSGGDGSAEYPYRIATPNDLNDIGNHVEDFNKCFVVVNDINLADYTGTQFNIIGTRDNPFTGVFDGNNHSILNFTYQSTGTNDIGIFGVVDDSNTLIKDLVLINPSVDAGTGSLVGSLVGYLKNATVIKCGSMYCSISGERWVGGLVGDNYSGTIIDCFVSGTVSATESEAGGLVGVCMEGGVISHCYTKGTVASQEFPVGNGDAGGLVGDIRDSMVSNSFSSADVSSEVMAGGLVGTNWNSSIYRCYATGSITGTDWSAGGLVGYSNLNSTILDSYATGDVSVPQGKATGGLVGVNENGSTLFHCYATGGVSGKDNVGGLVGYHYDSFYNKCFWDIDVNPDVNGIGNAADPNVIGETTVNMQTKSTFTDAGWDFVGESVNGPNDIWTINEGVDYPKLVWPLVNFVGWYEVDFADYSFFANRWLNTNCGDSNDCDGCDLDFSDRVDANDLQIFSDHWLEGAGQ